MAVNRQNKRASHELTVLRLRLSLNIPHCVDHVPVDYRGAERDEVHRQHLVKHVENAAFYVESHHFLVLISLVLEVYAISKPSVNHHLFVVNEVSSSASHVVSRKVVLNVD